MLRIRIFYPRSRIQIFSIPDPGSASKNLSILTPKNFFLSSRKYDPGCSSRIRILNFYPSRIPGSKSHQIPDTDPQHCHKHRSAGCSLLRAEGFSCSLDTSKLQFLKNKFFIYTFFSSVLIMKIQDPDPYPDSLEMLNPQLCIK